MILIIGLGNPGKEYETTRHNTGWMVLDEIAEGDRWKKNRKAQAVYLIKKIAGQETMLLRPMTFMNNSGIAAAYVKKTHPNLGFSDIIVIHDDKDLELGEIKIQSNKSAAGHKGVQSIINHLKNKKFVRIRIGISTEKINKVPTEKYVLQRFSGTEKDLLKKSIKKAVRAISTMLEKGLQKAMNEFN